MYHIKEAFLTLQGEGAMAGRAAIFCRFTGCNLWSGREDDRADSACPFCDTDFIGTNGKNGGRFQNEQSLTSHLLSLWKSPENPAFIVFTGGEPSLQLDQKLVNHLKDKGCEIAIETNGTRALPQGIDWICLSPKGREKPVITRCNELKLIYPQSGNSPDDFHTIQSDWRWLSPPNNPKERVLSPKNNPNYQLCIEYCLKHPSWRLNLQQHKILGID